MDSCEFNHSDVKIVATDIAFQGFFRLETRTIEHRLFRGGWSKPLSRELLVRGDAVGVLLFDPQRQQVVLIEQFRVGVNKAEHSPWLLELVAGIVEPGESYEDVARRESLEEANSCVRAMLPIAQYYSSPGGCDEFFAVFCGFVSASELDSFAGLESEGEDIKVHVLEVEEAFELLRSGSFLNAPTIIALQWLQMHYQEVLRRGLEGMDG